MLAPDYLDHAPDRLVLLWQQVEDDILRDVARRIRKMETLTPTANWQLWRYQQVEAVRQDVVKLLARYTGKSESEIRRLMQQAATRAMEAEDEIYYHYGLSPTPFAENETLQGLLNAGYQQTAGTFANLTATTANTVSGQFEAALDRAHLKVSSGAFDYKSAVKSAVNSLADTMKYVTYPTGHRDTLEVAARRAVLTGVNQTAAKLQVARADEMGVEFFETTAHGGARPSHAEWQGRQFHRGGAVDYMGKHYPDFEAATGYGTGAGICGWNCRHTFFAIFPELGAPPAWTQESLEKLDARDIEYNGEKYTRYEISQMQRARERTVRKYKRRYLAETEAGVDNTASAVKLRQSRQELAEFISATGGRADSARTSVAGFGRSEAGKASARSQAYHAEWLKSINAQSTSLNTVAKYYDAKYNNTEEYQLLKRYFDSVQRGMISPLAGFDNYFHGYNRVQSEIVGRTTSNGIKITYQSSHFMERVLGTIKDPKTGNPRNGVEIDDIIECLFNGSSRPVKYDEKNRPSQLLYTKKCAVTINPDTGELIQCNLYTSRSHS